MHYAQHRFCECNQDTTMGETPRCNGSLLMTNLKINYAIKRVISECVVAGYTWFQPATYFLIHSINLFRLSFDWIKANSCFFFLLSSLQIGNKYWSILPKSPWLTYFDMQAGIESIQPHGCSYIWCLKENMYNPPVLTKNTILAY